MSEIALFFTYSTANTCTKVQSVVANTITQEYTHRGNYSRREIAESSNTPPKTLMAAVVDDDDDDDVAAVGA